MKTKIWVWLLFLVSIVVFLVRCQKEESDISFDKNNYEKKGNLLVAKNASELSAKRIIYQNEIVPIVDDNRLFLKSAQEFPKIDLTKNYAFQLRAEVSSPVFESNILQATHVTIKDDYAFVTYNTKGALWLGAVEIFDVSDIDNPSIIASAIMPNTDVSSIDYFDGKIYIIGATGNFESLGYKSAAFLEVINLNENMGIASIDTMVDISSYVGTDVKVHAGKIMCTSGSDGHLTVFNLDYSPHNNFQIMDARSIDVNSEKAFVLQGQEGRIQQFDLEGFGNQVAYLVGGANTPDSKSEIAVNENYILAALNEGGLVMLNMDGSIKQRIPRPETPGGSLDENNVTNSVSLNNDLVLIGNGESGVHVGGIIEEHNDSIWMLGSMKFKGLASTNFVESKDSVIFVATGLEGLKIISISIDDGEPGDIEPTEPCESLMSDISKMFPENKDARNKHADLFNDTTHLNIYIEEDTRLYVTFIDEGAGWKNTFGYYSYPADNPPTDISKIEHHIVFPNASKENEGGALKYGDQVQLGNEIFKTGTVVGFYIVSKGWKNGMTVDGKYTLYTNNEFNENNFQQSTLFVSSNCNDLVLTFEDIIQNDNSETQCDFDFNDIILVIKDNPEAGVANTKIRYNNLPVK